MSEMKQSYFEEMIEQADKLVALAFGAPWCGPCKMLVPSFQKIALEINDEYICANVNIEENPDFSRKNNVVNIPTTIIYKNGLEIDKLVGFTSEEELEGFLKKHV
ncbi:thioredoxin domain-containing protein [Clostridium sp.]|uniref:thioredoxin family protein n=1 Tax=Clostridium sp. TaxID=1506 RepID=UPI003216ECAC